ncbi:subclass B1 metallo-beta-lactamase [uncultured Maribacter sp.]|uniref:subclass B1 metallo-beta-lactamase n=1 Tax=uncultured Maribacter sp. TaxID=431308 RepID=UPI002619FA78|nr:subclass B1 metallo-beta-lactamase [uncultured Maribacter sp.]
MNKLLSVPFLCIAIVFFSCKGTKVSTASFSNERLQRKLPKDSPIYKTDNLIIKKITNHIYAHISYLYTEDYGKVACNGMLVLNDNKVIVFDTPTDNKSSQELINFTTKKLNSKIIALIPTHFHEDCIGGLQEFEKHNIQLHVYKRTLELLEKKGQKFSKPITEFDNNLILSIGDENIYADFYGEGHTKDNIIGYFPKDNAIFGGCLIKGVGASKGYLGDANTAQWSKTVLKIKSQYPNAKVIIPGHGNWGGTELFDYTIKLFR